MIKYLNVLIGATIPVTAFSVAAKPGLPPVVTPKIGGSFSLKSRPFQDKNPTTINSVVDQVMALRAGGGVNAEGTKKKCPYTATIGFLSSLYGSGGVIYILAKAIKRVLPIAMEPFKAAGSSSVAPLTSFQLGCYVATCLFFAYAEGYKGFQKVCSISSRKII